MYVLKKNGLPRTIASLVVALALLFATLLMSCSDEPSSRPPDEMDQGSFINLLALIPLTEASRGEVFINDYARARGARDIEAPRVAASAEELEEYVLALNKTGLAPGPWISGYNKYAIGSVQMKGFVDTTVAQLEEARHLGFGIGDVNQSIMAGIPPYILEAATGRIDAKATDRALAACAECPDAEIREHRGVRFYGWGADEEVDISMSLHPPAYDFLGRGGRIAMLDSLVLRTIDTPGMRSLIDAYRDEGDSLANAPDFALAAGILDALDVYSALLVGNVEDLGFPGDLGAGGADATYTLLGTGVGNDEDGLYTVLVFVYESEDVARSKVEVFQEWLPEARSVVGGRPWTEFFPASEFWNDGRALVARLRTEHAHIWNSMVFNRENLLWPK